MHFCMRYNWDAITWFTCLGCLLLSRTLGGNSAIFAPFHYFYRVGSYWNCTCWRHGMEEWRNFTSKPRCWLDYCCGCLYPSVASNVLPHTFRKSIQKLAAILFQNILFGKSITKTYFPKYYSVLCYTFKKYSI